MARKQEQTSSGFVDAIGILLVAVPLALVILALGAQIAGQDALAALPQWLTQAGKSIWTWATGGAGVITSVLRTRGKDLWRAYLCWMLGTAFALIICTLGVARAMRAPRPIATGTLALRMHFRSNSIASPAAANTEPSWFRFDQLEPNNLTGQSPGFAVNKNGTVQPQDVLVDFPAHGKRFVARVSKAITESIGGVVGEIQQKPWSICLRRKDKDPGDRVAVFANLDCAEGHGCKTSEMGDPGWVEGCEAAVANASAPLFFFGVAEAASDGGPGWRVPSLATLRRLEPNRRSGYTEFNIRSESLVGVSDADTVYYDIKVNTATVLIDGLPKWSVGLPFDPAKGLEFDFGLENLNFSGADGGCEHIEVALSFRKKDREVKRIEISRLYAALRNPMRVTRDIGQGSKFAWGGKYVRPAAEGKIEVLAGAVNHVDQAQRWKLLIDRAGLKYQGQSIVGVIRPPLRVPEYYGLAIGLTLPSGQVQFTFNRASAAPLRAYLASLRSTNAGKAVFQSDPYAVEPPYGERPGYCESAAI
jgi:hypothetical protein